MSRKSKKSSPTKRKGTKKSANLSAPFAPDILRRAKALADKYRLILEPDRELGFLGRSIEMPNVFAEGSTADDCVAATRESLAVAVATMLEQGLQPPSPASPKTRRAQVNIRLTDEEKIILMHRARACGFRGISDYLRSLILGSLTPISLTPTVDKSST